MPPLYPQGTKASDVIKTASGTTSGLSTPAFSFEPVLAKPTGKLNFFTPISESPWKGTPVTGATFGLNGPSFGYEAWKQDIQARKESTKQKTPPIVQALIDGGRAVPRAILSTALTFAPEGVRKRIGEILPAQDFGKTGEVLLGMDAISAIPDEGSKFLLASGSSEDTARQYGWLAGMALTGVDLFPGAPGKKQAAKAAVTRLIKEFSEGKMTVEEAVSRFKSEAPSVKMGDDEVADIFRQADEMRPDTKVSGSFLNEQFKEFNIQAETRAAAGGKPPKEPPLGTRPTGGKAPEPEPSKTVPRDFTKQAEKIAPLSKAEQTALLARLDALGLKTREVVTVRQVEAAAQELGTDLPTLLKMSKMPEISAVQKGLKNVIASSGRFVAESEAKILRDPSLEPTLRPKIAAAQAQSDAALKELAPGVSNVGRALRMLREEANNTLDPAFWEMKAQRMLGPRPLTPEMKAIILNLTENQDRIGLTSFIMGLRTATWAEKIATLWKAGLLTAFRTHEANILGSLTVGSLETATNVLSTSLDVLLSLKTGKRTVVFSAASIAAKARAMVSSGPRKAGQFLKSGVYDESLMKKYDIPREINFDNKLADGYTKAIFRSLTAEDIVFREAALQESFVVQAETIAKNEALKGAAYKERVKELLTNPTNEMVLNAIDAAEYQTFTRESKLSNFLVSAKAQLQKGETTTAQLGGLALEMTFPFTGVPVNIAATLAEYSPLGFIKAMLNVARPSTRSQRAFVRDVTRAVTGTGFITFGAYLADKGLMTGNAPTSKPERDMFYSEGKQPNAIFIGGQWWQINRISPLGNLLTLGAEFNELGRTLEGYALYTATFWGGAKALSEMSFLQGASRAVSAIQDPEQSAGSYVRSAASSLIPTIVGDLQNLVDPKMRVAESVPQALMAKIPGLSTKVPVRRDVFGNTVEEAGGRSTIINPVRQTAAVDHPVLKEARDIGVNIGLPEREISGVKMDNFEFSIYQKVQGRLLEQTLKTLISSDGYKLLSSPEKEKEMKNTITELRQSLNEILFPALMIKRYNLPPETDPTVLRAALKELSKEERFRKLSREKQEEVLKKVLIQNQ